MGENYQPAKVSHIAMDVYWVYFAIDWIKIYNFS